MATSVEYVAAAVEYVIAATSAVCDCVAVIAAVCTSARCAIAVSLLLSVM